MDECPLCVPVPEAAQRLGFGRDYTYALVKAGRLRTIAVGRRRLVPVAELNRFIERELGTSAGGTP